MDGVGKQVWGRLLGQVERCRDAGRSCVLVMRRWALQCWGALRTVHT